MGRKGDVQIVHKTNMMSDLDIATSFVFCDWLSMGLQCDIYNKNKISVRPR